MSRGTAWFVHGATALLGVTGLVYGAMLYLMEPEDEFALANHPAQPDWQHAHVMLAPLLVFAVGLLWRTHIWQRIRRGFQARRGTGLALTGLFFVMVVSGYLIQVSDSWRLASVWAHGVSSCLWLLLYLVHQFGPRPKRGVTTAGRDRTSTPDVEPTVEERQPVATLKGCGSSTPPIGTWATRSTGIPAPTSTSGS